MEKNKPNKYFAFISYKREDEEWAVWFHHELENYHLPATLNGRTDLPTEFRPVFRDIDELKAGNLPEQIYDALATSAYLIVICSPNSAKSKWVNKEIGDFIEIGKAKGIDNVRNIFPFIVDGRPHAHNEEEECFPQALRDLSEEHEQVGGNVNESGRDKAFVKVLAGMLPNVAFDDLWNRYEHDKAEEERKKREERNKLLISQSRFVAEKANKLVEEGDSYTARRLLLEVMPKSINNPDRPYVIEAEAALRNASYHDSAILMRGRYSRPSISREGGLIAASDLESIKVWEVETGMEVLSIHGEQAQKVHSVDISSDGRYLASSSSKGINSIGIWDVKTGMAIRTIVVQEPARFVSFSPYGKYIVSVSSNFISVWAVETGELLTSIEEDRGIVDTAAFSPDERRIVFNSWSFDNHTIRICDIPTGKQLLCLEDCDFINNAPFSPEGKCIVTGSGRSVLVFDTLTGEKLHCFEGHEDRVHSAMFSSDGKCVLSASDDKTIRFWDVATGKQLYCLEGHSGGIDYAVFCSDGKYVVFASSDNTIRIRNILSKERLLTSNFATCASFSPDGKQIVFYCLGRSFLIFDVITGKKLQSFEGHVKVVNAAAFSPDGKYVVSASEDATIRIWDVATGKQLHCLKGHTDDSVKTAEFSPDGKRIVSASMGQGVRIWDIDSEDEIQSLMGHSFIACSASYSSDGKSVVCALDDGRVEIWEVNTGRVTTSLMGHSLTVSSATFSPDGKRVVTASSDGTIRIWEVSTGEQLHCLKGHTGGVESASFSPNGKYIVSASDDQSIRIWDIETGKEIQSFLGDRRKVLSASFSPNGMCIVSTGITGVRIWPFLPLQELIDQTRERFKDRPLTPEERRQYYLE